VLFGGGDPLLQSVGADLRDEKSVADAAGGATGG